MGDIKRFFFLYSCYACTVKKFHLAVYKISGATNIINDLTLLHTWVVCIRI